MELAEALRALADGKKVRLDHWEKGEFIHLLDGQIADEKNSHRGLDMSMFEANCWEVFEQLTTGKKITLYRRPWAEIDNAWVRPDWCTSKEAAQAMYDRSWQIRGTKFYGDWQTKEIEV